VEKTIRQEIKERLEESRAERKKSFWPKIKIRLRGALSNTGISAAVGGGGRSRAHSGRKKTTGRTRKTSSRRQKR